MIKYIDADATKINVDVLGHQCNTKGVMGAGIAKTIKQLYPDVYQKYRFYCMDTAGLLGATQLVKSKEGKYIANIFGQDDYRGRGLKTNYKALRKALEELQYKMFELNLKTLSIPYLIGCGLGGGDWDIVDQIINDIFGESSITCYICKFEV